VSNADDDRTLDERRLEVLIGQGAGLRVQIALTATVVATIAWTAVPAPWVVGWWLGAVGLRELRNASLQRMQARATLSTTERIRRVVLWNALLGAVSGSAALFMLPLDTTGDALLTMILVSWGAGGVATNATIAASYVAFGSFMFIPTALMWLLGGGWFGAATATLVLMLFHVQLRYARRNNETFEESFRMRQENAALAQRLAHESAQVALARDAAESANQAKSRFLAAASHDLRQPLQALALNSGELMRAADRETAPLAAEVKRSIDDLRAMLDGLLDLSNLDAGSVQVRPRNVALTTLLEGVAASFRAAASARGLQLSVDCAPGLVAHTDPDLLRRVVSNLIDNAIKFTPSGRIDVRAEPTVDGVHIHVRDSGVGISASEHEHIFEELVQLHNPQRDRARGYGLGLSIVRRLVGLLGIELQLQSAPGEGSTFSLHLKPSSPDAPALPVQCGTAPPARAEVSRVLVLDDDVSVRSAYARALAAHGMHTALAGHITEALRLLPGEQPQVALVDYRLADGEDGLAAITALRAASPGLAALLCSADASPALAAAAASAGVQLLRKPIDGDGLAVAINAAWLAHAARGNLGLAR
jgi:signal transduction histidine kinase/ActR/RegA family two-component response regulator